MKRVPSRSDRVAGAVLAAAIGDALGHPVEFITSMAGIRRAFGPDGVTGYALLWEENGQKFAPYTDDTQMAEVVLRCLLASRDAREPLETAMQRMGQGFASWAQWPLGGHRSPGLACIRGSQELARGRAWDAASTEAGGCGSVMRAYPFGLLFADDERKAAAWAAAHSRLTHGHPMALAACAAMAVAMARAVKGRSAGDILDGLEEAAERYDGATARLCRAARTDAEHGASPDDVLARLLGWNAREAIAAAVYVFANHSSAPRLALLQAANTPGDSDSIATLVGALVGTVNGLGELPEAWVAQLERTGELLALARQVDEDA